MIISFKDGIKLVGISLVCFSAVFVCTFMLNYYLDVLPLKSTLEKELVGLYDAQVATAKLTSAITGGILGLIAVIMIIFYIRLYIENHSKDLGVIKSMGYSPLNISLRFWVFGLSVFTGCVLGYGCGYACMPFIYKNMTIDGIGKIIIHFHYQPLVFLVILPTLFFTAFSCLFAYFKLKTPVNVLLRGKNISKSSKSKSNKDRPFLKEMCVSVLKSKKLLVFFFTFSCFCFSAMIQMGLSMKSLSSKSMGIMILLIGVVLSVVTTVMALTSLINSNKQNISLMKVFGYSSKECILSVLGGFIPFAFIGFILGTVYQYGLLTLMVKVVFAGVADMPAYNFDFPIMFITLAAFIICYSAFTAYWGMKINKISLKEVMSED